MKSKKPEIDRRDFIGSVAAVGAAAMSGCALSGGGADVPIAAPTTPRRQDVIRSQAPDGRPLKAGLIGCGGRGRGAAVNFLDAGANLRITALADVFPDRVETARNLLLKEKGQEIPDSQCFLGFDAYQKLLESGVDLVLHATPPHFRPEHFAAAIEARKHVFIEKPVAVDVPGAVSVVQTAERAAKLGLSVMTGTQLRRELPRLETQKRIRDGAIGDIQAI
ncbi:MAG TPA: Gfo/Idh/MocA family oxidoreductase, partial [Vicinamibacterales bacterium]|nr:Gfo/Idh/MocA family oxidoreductase [Vicinamibacterales bacterium]